MCRPYPDHPRKFSLPRAVLSLAVVLAIAPASRSGEPALPAWDAKAAAHLLSRTGFGGSPEEATRLAKSPLDKAVDLLLDEAVAAKPPARPAWVKDVWVNTERRYADMTREEFLPIFRSTRARYADEVNQLRAWWLQEMIASKAPLREVMTLFWHGHFTGSTQKVAVSQAQYQQNETFRKHALGNFKTFLGAVTLDPAMMIFLDMEESNKANPNENYARELLELFTLGEGNYTEKDIREIARALTGWTLDAPKDAVKSKRPTDPKTARTLTRDGLLPAFVPDRHDDGEKIVFGKKGKFKVDEVLDLVVAHSACGKHLAGRLIDFFGAADPDGKLRDRMAKAFADGKYEVKPVLKVLFTSPEFYATASRASQIKSPVRLLVGACRQLNLDGEATAALAQVTVPMGQELLNPPNVKGWPGGKDWVSASTLALRFRLGEPLLDGKELTGTEPLGRTRLLPLSRDEKEAKASMKRLLEIDAERKELRSKDGLKVRFDAKRLFPKGPPDDPTKLVDTLLGRMVIAPVRPSARTAILEACKATKADERPALVARLVLAMPEYQME